MELIFTIALALVGAVALSIGWLRANPKHRGVLVGTGLTMLAVAAVRCLSAGDPKFWTHEDLLTGLGLAAIGIIFLIVGVTRETANDRTVLVWVGVLILAAAVANLLTRKTPGLRLVLILASLPSLILASHGAFLYYVRSQVVPKASGLSSERLAALAANQADATGDEQTYRRVLLAGERYFSAQALILRYGVPALLMFALGVTISNAVNRWAVHHYFYANACAAPLIGLCDVLGVGTESASVVPRVSGEAIGYLPDKCMVGASYGLVGAYAYVLLYLGKRSFRLDITPGAAMWSTITLAVGPVLAGCLGPFILTNLWPSQADYVPFSVLFTAGFAPRLVVESLEEAARRVLSNPSQATLPTRTIPLTQVRGMTRASQERLEEEGIDDANQLAMADPYRLLRNTSFDKRQILAWMDHALLMMYFPETFSALERRGITGAMGLAWYAREANQEALGTLAESARIEEPVLRAAAKRLSADRQQTLLHILYVLDESGSTDGSV